MKYQLTANVAGHAIVSHPLPPTDLKRFAVKLGQDRVICWSDVRTLQELVDQTVKEREAILVIVESEFEASVERVSREFVLARS